MSYSHEVRKKMKGALRELRQMRKLNNMTLEFGRLANRPAVVREASDFAPRLENQIKQWKKALVK
jgi:hypothetical protein